MTKPNEKTLASEAKKNAEAEARAFSEPEQTEAPRSKRKSADAERDQLVAEGKRVFTETATDVPEFNPVYAPQIERKEVDVRAAQSVDADDVVR